MSTERGLRLDDVVIGPWGRVLLPPTTAFSPPGTTLGVLGDAGSGKTTVLETVAGRRRPLRGTVRLDGAPPAPRTVGYAEQEHALPDGLTAAEHLAVPLLAHGTRPGDWSEVEALLDALGLPAAAHHNLLEELSGGQQQRVALARALVGRPALVCLDDPVSELDATTSELVWSAIAAVARDGAVVVVATPRPDDAARFDRTLLLDVAAD